MTKQVSNKQVGPFGDVEINGDDAKKERRKKEIYRNEEESGDKVDMKSKKERHVSQDRVKNPRLQELERKERERRERYEREVAEAERNQRQMEIDKWEKERERARRSKNPSSVIRYKPRRPPAGYKDPHEVCKQALPRKVKEEKRQEIKALMNCIAFTPSQTNLTSPPEERAVVKGRKPTVEEMDNSLSSDTTSDITDVTPRSSSSGCSSMSKQSVCIDKTENVKVEPENVKKSKQEDKLKRENEVNLKKSNSKNSDEEKKKDNQISQQEVTRNTTEVELEEMKYLQDAFEDLDVDEETSDFASSIISGLSEERRAKCNRKNMTFTNEQLREIERVNLILLKKIMNHRKTRIQPQVQQSVNRKTSAAINRARLEEKIERENKPALSIMVAELLCTSGVAQVFTTRTSNDSCFKAVITRIGMIAEPLSTRLQGP